MRCLLVCSTVALMATASVALAGSETGTATITLLARPTADPIGSGVDTVMYDDPMISGGFCVDVMLSADNGEADAGMAAAGVGLNGDAGFHYKAMTLFWGAYVNNYVDGVDGSGNPANNQGWNVKTAVNVSTAGNLPLVGGANNEIGAVAVSPLDTPPGTGVCSAGFLGYLEFDAVPSVEASFPLVISPTAESYVGGTDNVIFGTIVGNTLTIIPEPATALLLIGALPFLRRRR